MITLFEEDLTFLTEIQKTILVCGNAFIENYDLTVRKLHILGCISLSPTETLTWQCKLTEKGTEILNILYEVSISI